MSTFTPTASPSPTPTGTPSPTATPIPLVYVFPVQPAARAVFKQGGHGYGATDIFAWKGTQYVAVTSGIVDFVCAEDLWDPETDDPATRGGLMVAIIGDDGVRYYGSHLSEIAEGITPGVRVEAGQLLGLVGNTGNARTTDPHVHFGISHPTYPEDWRTRRGEVDPFPYLQAWALGYAVTPILPTPTSSPNSGERQLPTSRIGKGVRW